MKNRCFMFFDIFHFFVQNQKKISFFLYLTSQFSRVIGGASRLFPSLCPLSKAGDCSTRTVSASRRSAHNLGSFRSTNLTSPPLQRQGFSEAFVLPKLVQKTRDVLAECCAVTTGRRRETHRRIQISKTDEEKIETSDALFFILLYFLLKIRVHRKPAPHQRQPVSGRVTRNYSVRICLSETSGIFALPECSHSIPS